VFQPETLRELQKRQGFLQIELGVYIWGGLTIILALFCLGIVFAGGIFHVSAEAQHLKDAIPTEPCFLLRMYLVLKDNGSLVAGILGFSGLAWAHFFAVNNRIPAQERVPEPEPPERAEG
jgi:hypothetical protein